MQNSWKVTSKGDARGYIEADNLKELWFHTGTRCNLSCPFCLEGSSPTADRLSYLSLEDVQPYLDEAVKMGVERFSFTGGEPFLNKAMISILEAALEKKPCLVLTNGTKPLLKKLSEIETLKRFDHPIQFRISIDYADQKKHDEGRGEGTFDLAFKSMKALQECGFKVSMARHAEMKENKTEIDATYDHFFKEYEIDTENLNIVAFPDFLTPGSKAEVPEITTNCMTTYQDDKSRKEFMCSFSRMVIKREDQCQVSACTLVDDDPDYDLGESLKESMDKRVMLRHHRCFSCFSFGASCSESS